MLADFINKLDEANAKFDPLQLAEILWLAQFAPRVETWPELADLSTQREQPKEQPESEPSNPIGSPPPAKDRKAKQLFAKSQTTGAGTVPARSVRVPDVSPLPDALAVGRALRPLRRRVASRWDFRLDEDATVEASAEASSPKFTALVPVMRPALQRWFDLEFIVEQSVSMSIWRDVARELHQLLEHTGAFGDVRRWTLFRRNGQAFLLDAAGREHSPRQLRDSANRRLMMVFSDGSSRGWMDGAYARTIADWAEHSTVVLLQPFGERLWARTMVGEATTEITSPEPGAPNAKLNASSNWWAEPNGKQIALPIVSLNPEMIARWARMLALPGNAFRAAMLEIPPPVAEPKSEPPVTEPRKRSGEWNQLRELLFTKPAPTSEPAAQPEPINQPAAAELVSAFRSTASPEAFDLAVRLSFMPLTMEVMRVTQRAMSDAPQLEHLAEFLLGGLVVPVGQAASLSPPGKDSRQAGSLSDLMFEFRPGVRQELLSTILRSEIEQVVRNAVSDLIGQRIGSVREFIALMLDPKGKERLPVAADYAQFFAEITLPALRQMGYEFDAGDGGSTQTEIPMPMGTDGSPSVITPVSFEFRTARLKPDGKIQKLDTGHAWQFIEQIGSAPLEMVFIPGGKFLMGSSEKDLDEVRKDRKRYGRSADWVENEKPQHEVTIPPFYIGKFTVTQSQWRAVAALPKIEIELEPNPSHFKGDNRPVEQVNWSEAREFCARLANHTGRLYRLPSEAEWEYACRAGTTTPFAFGETITNKVVNYYSENPYGNGPKEKSRGETIEVGSLGVANDFGLFDMHGNVWEWCEDHRHDSYQDAPTDGSAWLSGKDLSSRRVVRGGSWNLNGNVCRSAFRNGLEPGIRNNAFGFRVVVAARSS